MTVIVKVEERRPRRELRQMSFSTRRAAKQYIKVAQEVNPHLLFTVCETRK